MSSFKTALEVVEKGKVKVKKHCFSWQWTSFVTLEFIVWPCVGVAIVSSKMSPIPLELGFSPLKSPRCLAVRAYIHRLFFGLHGEKAEGREIIDYKTFNSKTKMLERIWEDNLKATNLEEENLFFFFLREKILKSVDSLMIEGKDLKGVCNCFSTV